MVTRSPRAISAQASEALGSRRCAVAKGLGVEITCINSFAAAPKTHLGKRNYESAQRCRTHGGPDTACCDPAWGTSSRTVSAVASGLGLGDEEGRDRARTRPLGPGNHESTVVKCGNRWKLHRTWAWEKTSLPCAGGLRPGHRIYHAWSGQCRAIGAERLNRDHRNGFVPCKDISHRITAACQAGNGGKAGTEKIARYVWREQGFRTGGRIIGAIALRINGGAPKAALADADPGDHISAACKGCNRRAAAKGQVERVGKGVHPLFSPARAGNALSVEAPHIDVEACIGGARRCPGHHIAAVSQTCRGHRREKVAAQGDAVDLLHGANCNAIGIEALRQEVVVIASAIALAYRPHQQIAPVVQRGERRFVHEHRVRRNAGLLAERLAIDTVALCAHAPRAWWHGNAGEQACIGNPCNHVAATL